MEMHLQGDNTTDKENENVENSSFNEVAYVSPVVTGPIHFPPPHFYTTQPPPPPPSTQAKPPTSPVKQKAHPCRDHARGNCTRINCKFSHEADENLLKKVNICHDFQNKGCFRTVCKYAHLTTEQQAEFYRTKQLPQGVHETYFNNCKSADKDLQSNEPNSEIQNESSQLENQISFDLSVPPPPIPKNYPTHSFQVPNPPLSLPSTNDIKQISKEFKVQKISPVPPETNMEAFTPYQNFNANNSEVPRKKFKCFECGTQESTIKLYENEHMRLLSIFFQLAKEVEEEEQLNNKLMADLFSNQKSNQIGNRDYVLFLFMKRYLQEMLKNVSKNTDNHVIDISQQSSIKPNINQQFPSVPTLNYLVGNSGPQILMSTNNTPQIPTVSLDTMSQQLLKMSPQTIGSDMQHLISSERQIFNSDREQHHASENSERQNVNIDNQPHGNLNDFQMFPSLDRNMNTGNINDYVANLQRQPPIMTGTTHQNLNSNQYNMRNNHNQQLIGVASSESQPYMAVNSQLLNIGQYQNQPLKQQYQQFVNPNQYVNQSLPKVLAPVSTQNSNPGVSNLFATLNQMGRM